MTAVDFRVGDVPPPPASRPRVLLVGTAFVSAGVAMAFVGLLGTYLALRHAAVSGGQPWLPEGVTIPLTPGTMGLATLLMAAVIVQWAVYAAGNNDRPATYCALGLTVLMGLAYIVEIAYYYTQIGVGIGDPSGFGLLLYVITGAHLALVGGAMVFVLLMAFRTLGGQYSGRDREGVAAAALFWHVTVAIYVAVWFVIFVNK